MQVKEIGERYACTVFDNRHRPLHGLVVVAVDCTALAGDIPSSNRIRAAIAHAEDALAAADVAAESGAGRDEPKRQRALVAADVAGKTIAIRVLNIHSRVGNSLHLGVMQGEAAAKLIAGYIVDRKQRPVVVGRTIAGGVDAPRRARFAGRVAVRASVGSDGTVHAVVQPGGRVIGR